MDRHEKTCRLTTSMCMATNTKRSPDVLSRCRASRFALSPWISDNYPRLAYQVDHAGCEKELESCASMLGTSRILPYKNKISQLCFSRSSHSPSSTTPGGAKVAICRGPKPNLVCAANRLADEGVLPSGTETNSETDGLQIGAQPEVNPSGGSPQCPTGLQTVNCLSRDLAASSLPDPTTLEATGLAADPPDGLVHLDDFERLWIVTVREFWSPAVLGNLVRPKAFTAIESASCAVPGHASHL